MHLFWPNTIGLMTKLVPIIGLKNIQLVEGKLKVQSIYKLLRLLKSSILGRVKSCFVYGSSHFRSVLIGVKYRNCRQTLDVYLLFAILHGQIKS